MRDLVRHHPIAPLQVAALQDHVVRPAVDGAVVVAHDLPDDEDRHRVTVAECDCRAGSRMGSEVLGGSLGLGVEAHPEGGLGRDVFEDANPIRGSCKGDVRLVPEDVLCLVEWTLRRGRGGGHAQGGAGILQDRDLNPNLLTDAESDEVEERLQPAHAVDEADQRPPQVSYHAPRGEGRG